MQNTELTDIASNPYMCMKKKTKKLNWKNILIGALGITTGVLLIKNRNLEKTISGLTAVNENNKDLIRGQERAIRGLSYGLGKEVGSKYYKH